MGLELFNCETGGDRNLDCDWEPTLMGLELFNCEMGGDWNLFVMNGEGNLT